MNGFNLLPKAIFVSMILASCGKLSRPTGESEVKIYNGVEVDSDHWITQTAANLQIFKDNGIAECSAAVIGPRALITNAHCFLREDGSNANVSVAFAMYGNKAQSGISKVKWWNLYNNPTTPLDMAIVELEDDVPKNIVPAFIAGENQPLNTGWIFGYGNNGYTDAAGNQSTVLRISRVDCYANAPTFGGLQKLCVSNWDETPNAGSRSGDSGGAVLKWDSEAKRMYVVGLNWGRYHLDNGMNNFAVIDISQLRSSIRNLNTGCRLKINNLPCN